MKTNLPTTNVLKNETIAAIKAVFEMEYSAREERDGAEVRSGWTARIEGDKVVIDLSASAEGRYEVATSELDSAYQDGYGEAEATITATVIETAEGILIDLGEEENYPLDRAFIGDWAGETLSDVESEAVDAAKENAAEQADYRSVRFERHWY